MAEELKPDKQPQEVEAQPQGGAQAEPHGGADDGIDWKAEARKWEARSKANAKKAEAYDELQEANKTELQRLVERAEKAEADAKAASERAKELEDGLARQREVAEKAAEFGVDADVLSRMAGDVGENAALLRSKAAKTPPYPQVTDHGEVTPPKMTKEDYMKERDPVERVRKRALYLESLK